MKALILSIKAGYGHHSTAQAMIRCFEGHGIYCEMLDTFEYISRFLGESIQDGYLLSTKYLKEAYGRVYSTLDKKDEPYYRFSPTAGISKMISKKLEKYILDFNPDFVIGTHSYAAVLITVLAQRGMIHCPTVGVVTDFTIHPFWESTKLDYYVLPDMLLNTCAIKKGIPEHKILPIGIPIHQKFSRKKDKIQARADLGLDNKTTIMVMMGSMGFGDIVQDLKDLDDYPGDFQIVAICGNNKRAKQAIDRQVWKKDLRNFGFLSNVDEYMDAADILITKPGGLTTSEAMAKGLPLILMNPIPGQEERNMHFLVNAGAAIMVTDTFPLENALHQFLNCPWRLENAKDCVAHLGKPNAAEDLYKVLMEHKKQDKKKFQISLSTETVQTECSPELV